MLANVPWKVANAAVTRHAHPHLSFWQTQTDCDASERRYKQRLPRLKPAAGWKDRKVAVVAEAGGVNNFLNSRAYAAFIAPRAGHASFNLYV